MIRNALGTLISRTAVAATTNRTSQRFAPRKSTSGLPAMTTRRTSPRLRSARSGTSVKTILPASVRRPQERATAVTLLVHAAHDRVEGGHDRHRVGDQVARHQDADRLEVDERGVVDPHPERLVGAVADHVGSVLAARPLDRGVGPTGSRTEQPRELGHDRAVGHLVEALVDDPEALLDLVDPDEVASQAVALVPGGDVEVELGEDPVRMGPPEVERDAAGPQVR